MFKKLVTNLPYSPGLLNQIGFYSKRLSQEEFTRKLGAVFMVMALVLNINLLYFGPENSVLASPGNDVISGGIYGSSAKEMQDHAIAAMKSSPSTAAILDFYNITEDDIRNTELTTLNTGDENLRSVGRQSFGRGGEVCQTHDGIYFCERSMYAAYSYRSLDVQAISGIREGLVGSEDPWFSLIESCGNVVVRVGGEEDIEIKKVVRHKVQSADVGDEVSFRLKLTSNNDNGAKNPVITDTIPNHMEYVSHFPKDIFDKHSVKNGKLTLSGSKDRYELAPNSTMNVDITFRILSTAPAGAKLCNSASVESLGDTALTTSEPCVTVVTPSPEPACVALRMIGGSGSDLTRRFEAEVDPDGATVEKFVFSYGDNTTDTITTTESTATTSHTYEQPGEYVAKVLVHTSEGTFGNSGSCKKNVTVAEVPIIDPISVQCDYLNVLSINDRTYNFEAAGSADNASVVQFNFDFGDGNSAEVASDNDKATIEHTFDDPGIYRVEVTVVSNTGDEVTSGSCVVEVEIEVEKCPYNESLPIDDPNCVVTPTGAPNIVQRKLAQNVTQQITDAHNTTAAANDVIEYVLETENDGDATANNYVIKEAFSDVLQYANIVDLDGGNLNEETKILSWPAEDIEAGETIRKTVTVKIKSPIPDTPVAVSDAGAYDLMLENVYGNNVTIKLPKTPGKVIEEVTKELPETGIGTNATISTLFFGTVTYFYSRNRLISKELKMIKKEFSGAGV